MDAVSAAVQVHKRLKEISMDIVESEERGINFEKQCKAQHHRKIS